jgi:hypothetical protein
MSQQTATTLAKPDPSLPRAVRAQVERVRQLTTPEPPAPPVVDEPTPPAQAAAIEPVAAPTPEPQPAIVPSTPPAPPEDPRANDPGYWKQRFQVTQGMLDKERRERTATERGFQEQLDELRTELRAAKQAQPAAAPAAVDLTAYFTPAQIEQYGEEQCKTLASVAIRVAREQTQAAIAAELQPLREQREQDTKQRQRTEQEQFLDALAERVPDYAAIDESQGWQDWLAQDDDHTGVQRQVILTQHVNAKRADRLAVMFNAYKATQEAPPAPPVAASGKAGIPPGPVPPPAAARGYPSQSEIRDYYKRSAIGKVQDKERQEFEARLQLQRPAA